MLKYIKNIFSQSELSIITHQNEQLLIQEIHDCFDNAQDELLSNAEKVLKELSIETESGILRKAELLAEIGFTSNPAVEKAQQIKIKEKETQEAAALLHYYKQEYPFQKILTTGQLDNICKKYNLIYAPISHYKEEVPDKNLLEIKNVKKLKQEDFPENVRMLTITRFYPDDSAQLKEIFKYPIKLANNNIRYDSDREVMGLARSLGYTGNAQYVYGIDGCRIDTVMMNGLFIAAPKNHFDLNGLSEKGFGFLDVKTIILKDPIVFRYIRGDGIQILSKWGIEANDHELINPIEN